MADWQTGLPKATWATQGGHCGNELETGLPLSLSSSSWLGDKTKNKMVGKVIRDSWKDNLSFPFKDTATLLQATGERKTHNTAHTTNNKDPGVSPVILLLPSSPPL
uniref:Uncharacterized protein n=1 Tax=Oryza brachyantha TaxID=4533 RepID=J3MTZ9_ORYBR